MKKKQTKSPKAKKAPKLKYMHAGHPPSFTSPEDMALRMDSYFALAKGRGRGWKERPSKAGLFYHLGVSRETMGNYLDKKEYFDTIKRAYALIETQWVNKLDEAYPTGGIFYLKNAFKEEYRDRYDHTSDGAAMAAPVIVMYGPKDRLAQVMEKRAKKP